jgi:hypothetical protein
MIWLGARVSVAVGGEHVRDAEPAKEPAI